MNGSSDLPAVSAYVSSIQFGDGTNLSLSPNDVLVIVGPNNAGKSEALRAIHDLLGYSSVQSPVVQTLSLQRVGSADEFLMWLRGRSIVQRFTPPAYSLFGSTVNEAQATFLWSASGPALSDLLRWFCHRLSAEERLHISNPVMNIAMTTEAPSHPIHVLYRDDGLELRLSAKFRKAFGVDLVVHRNAGSQIPLYVGDRPMLGPDEDRLSLRYIERLEKLQPLQRQGDGMRSFAGVLLATSVGRESILLIDEPEAFLHPPQARFLGTTLVKNRNKPRQLFIATHSTDILSGILDAESADVHVVRIRREGNTNVVRLLSNERIRELWGDPLLRYSNILSGLFHEAVVVCESDSDCRFYSAMLDSLFSTEGNNARRPDYLFTHCGGKQRLPLVIRALREVDVPIKAVADFDVLSEKEPLKSIVEAFGVDWSTIEQDWRHVKNAVDSKKPEFSTLEVKSAITRILDDVQTPTFPNAPGTEIQSLLKRSSSWANAKAGGRSFVPQGEPSRACIRLLQTLRNAGLFIVEVGELEGYVRSVDGHGPKWVNAVLSRPLNTDPELETARKFVRDLVS